MSDSNSLDEQVLANLLMALVTEPENVKVTRNIDEQGVLLSIIVSPKDMGIVIGRNGSMVNAIRTIMRAVGKANKMNIRIQFLEPDGTIKYGTGTQDKQGGDNSEYRKNEDSQVTSTDTTDLDSDLKDFIVN